MYLHPKWGFPKVTGIFLGIPIIRTLTNIFRQARSSGLSFVVMENIMGSTLGSPNFGKLQQLLIPHWRTILKGETLLFTITKGPVWVLDPPTNLKP